MPHGNFHRLIDRFGPFTQIDASFYYSNIVCAIGFIHKHGLVSRDIKSENFLIGPDGYLVMTDLGLAERVGGSGTWNNVGTPQYMAPELIEPGYPMGRAVDWWASGVMLYEMLTKRVVCLTAHSQHLLLLLPSLEQSSNTMCSFLPPQPFQGVGNLSVHFNITMQNYAWPKKANWGNSLKHIISRLFTRDPRERLGYSGTTDVTKHPWLSHIDWDLMSNRVYEVRSEP